MDETLEEPEVKIKAENSRKYEISKTLQSKQNQPVMSSKLEQKAVAGVKNNGIISK